MSEKPFDVNQRYVRIINKRAGGLVEFEFSIGEPEMMVELVMPQDAFDAFCAHNHVVFLADKPAAPENDEWSWNLRDATHQRFR